MSQQTISNSKSRSETKNNTNYSSSDEDEQEDDKQSGEEQLYEVQDIRDVRFTRSKHAEQTITYSD